MEVQAPGAKRRLTALAVALCLPPLAAACGRDPEGGRDGDRKAQPEEVVLTPEAAREARANLREERPNRRLKPQVVELRGAGAEPALKGDPTDDAPSPGAPTDDEVRAELREARANLAKFKKHLNSTAFLQTGKRARVLGDGTAVAPENAPDVVKRVIMAANEIAKFPYKWGGGHGAWRDTGYDCSGSVSFALAGAGLLGRPLTSGGFMSFGAPGHGRWITIYANEGHMFMVVAGLRFDTSGRADQGTRWQAKMRSGAGYTIRHPEGL